MKLTLKKISFDGRKNERSIVSYKILNLRKCCDEILGGDVELNGDEIDYERNEDYIHLAFTYEGECELYYKSIEFCPFCGEKIFVEIVDYEDATKMIQSWWNIWSFIHHNLDKIPDYDEKIQYKRAMSNISDEIESYSTTDLLSGFKK